MQASFSAAQFSSSKSFSSASFSSTRQAMASEHSHALLQEMPSGFSKMSLDMDAPNNQISTIDEFKNNGSKYNDDKTLFQNNFVAPNNFNKSSFENMNDFPNFSVSRTQGAQYSKASVTKTTTNRMITKRIIRKIVNGEIVEEDEEYDEIENEPQTEQIVVNNATHFDNVDMKVGGKFFGKGNKEFFSVKGKENNQTNKNSLKAIEPTKEKTGLSRIFSMGKKKKQDFNTIGK